MKKAFSTIITVVITAIVVAILSGVIVYSYAISKKNLEIENLKKQIQEAGEKTVQQEESTLKSEEATETQTSQASSERIVDQGVTWQKPEKLGDLKLIDAQTNETGGKYNGSEYFKVGTNKDGNSIILALVKAERMGEYFSFQRFIKIGDKYFYIPKNSDDTYNIFHSTVIPKDDIVFQSLLPDEKIINNSTELIKQDWATHEIEFVNSQSGTKIGETKWGDLYVDQELKGILSESIKVSHYFVKLNDSTKMIYEPKPTFMRDDRTFNLSFSDKNVASLTFNKIATGGCGGGGGTFPVAANKDNLASKKELGASINGGKIYYFDDKNNSLIKAGYEAYNMDGMKDKKSIEEFTKNYGVVIWEDDYGSNVIYLNSKFSPAVECGKPVIYLYPEKETVVSVKVGAKMTKSEPIYDGGWEALAKPNGELVVDGKKYDSLFWEGLGYGQYPVVNSGTIVERQNVKNIIEKQLRSMNLNQKETVDFLEFWLPKMPETPFVRLTWFTNKELDRLAPLQINPRPDSVIRVFLDFEGLNEKVNITPQILPTFQRTGFTAVEWGGLLKGK